MRKSTSVKTIPASPGPANVSTPAAFEDPKLAVQTEPSHPLNEFTDPSLLLVGRLEKWKNNVMLILRYAESHASSQASLTSGLEKTRKIFQDQRPTASETEQEKSGIDGVLNAIFVETENLLRASDIAATNIRQAVIPPLEELIAEIDQHHREIKDNSVSAMKDIEKLRIHTFKHMETLNGVVNSGAIPTENKEDPYIVKRQMVGVLNSQLNRENDHARNVVAIQTNFAKFDIKVVQTIQNSLKDLENIVTEYNNSSTNSHRVVSETYSAVGLDQDWNTFQESNKDVFLPTTGFQRDPAKLQFENMDHIYTKAIVEGPLNRKARVLRSLQLGFYVLTPSGFLHGFKSEDAIKDPLPELSLFIPECDVEPLDPRVPDEFKVYGKDRNSKLGTRRNFVFRTLNAGDAQLWHDALLEVSHDITNASVDHVEPVPVAASSPPRGFASVSKSTSTAADATAGTAVAAASGGVAAGAGVVGAIGLAASGRDRTNPTSGSAAGFSGEPESDDTEVQSLQDPNNQFFTEEENERGSSSPLPATAAATTLGISPRLRAQSPFQSYRNHNGEPLGKNHHVDTHDDIVPMSLDANNVSRPPEPAPLARKLDFEGEAKKTHAYNVLADDSTAINEANDFVEANHKVETVPDATVDTVVSHESVDPLDASQQVQKHDLRKTHHDALDSNAAEYTREVVEAPEEPENGLAPVVVEAPKDLANELAPAVVETTKDLANELDPTVREAPKELSNELASTVVDTPKELAKESVHESQVESIANDTAPLGDVEYDVAKAVGIADAASSGVTNETGFTEQKDILSAQGYAVNGLGTEHKALQDDELQREATIRAQKNGYQTSVLTGHIDEAPTTVFTESGEPVVVGKDAGDFSGPFFSEPAGDPIFADASDTVDKSLSSKPVQSSIRGDLVDAAAIPAKKPHEANISDTGSVEATNAVTATATATAPTGSTVRAEVPKGTSAPATHNKLEPPAPGLKKTETTNSNASTTKSKRFSKRFISRLKHGFRHREKSGDV